MEKSSFFNSVGGDRVYKAEEWAEYFASFIGNGVFPVPSDGLQVEANGSSGIVLRAGRAWINGYFYFNTDDLNMELNTADGVLNRIDRIVIRWDLTARTISAVIKSSAPSNKPTAPALQRDADAYELCLADVYVRAGSTAVLQSDITDQRYNSSLCGIVKGTVEQIDASALAKQFNDYAELFKEETKLDFEAWFEEIRGMLSEDLAGSLALAIDDINQSKGQPGGIATLDDGGKLTQMPTAADVGALSTFAISSGSNANGIWIQLEGGIMICKSQVTAQAVGSGQHGGAIWTFPVKYKNPPTVTACAVLDSSAGAIVWVGGKTISQVGLHVINNASSSRNIPIDVISVGIW